MRVTQDVPQPRRERSQRVRCHLCLRRAPACDGYKGSEQTSEIRPARCRDVYATCASPYIEISANTMLRVYSSADAMRVAAIQRVPQRHVPAKCRCARVYAAVPCAYAAKCAPQRLRRLMRGNASLCAARKHVALLPARAVALFCRSAPENVARSARVQISPNGLQRVMPRCCTSTS